MDAIVKEDALIDYAHKIGLLGIAITDHEDLGSHVRAQKHLEKRKKENPEDSTWQDFKVILGNEIYLCRNGLTEKNFVKGEDYFFHFILLALDEIGHEQLRELSTRAFKHSWFRNMRRVPTYYTDIEEIIGTNPGHVWASTACLGGRLPNYILNNNLEKAKLFISWCSQNFGENFSLELQPSNQEEQVYVNKELIKLSKEFNIPYIITTDTHYLREKDRKIHSAFLNSRGGERETESFYMTTYLMNEKEIHKYMDKQIGEEAVLLGLNNTKQIINKLKEYSLIKETKLPYLPFEILEPTPFMKKEVINNGMIELLRFVESEEQADRQLAYKIIKFCQENSNITDLKRIELELKSVWDTSEKMNIKWSRYLLQVSDYIKIFWEDGDTIVGPARGSGAGFYLNFILGISQVDPTREKAKMFPWRLTFKGLLVIAI